MSTRKTAGWASLGTLLLSATLLVTLSTPANAATASISGTITPCGQNKYYATSRVNSLNQNSVSFKATRLGPCGNALVLGLRGTQGATASHAKVTVTNTSSIFKFKATNGASYISGGTFYVTGNQAGACGYGCTGSFAGTLTYSVPAG